VFRKGKMSLYKAINKRTEQALMIQVNADIEEAAQSAAHSLIDESFQGKISYPPNHGFSQEDLTALDALKVIPNLESALRKVIADAASYPIFRVFEYIDGIADPNNDAWLGIYLVERPHEDTDVEIEDTSYHDSISAHYWDWRRLRPTKEWKLDVLSVKR
jgi:hypothetical protein